MMEISINKEKIEFMRYKIMRKSLRKKMLLMLKNIEILKRGMNQKLKLLILQAITILH